MKIYKYFKLYNNVCISSFSTAFGTKGSASWKITNLALCGFGFGITFSLNTMIIIDIMGMDMLLPVLGLSGAFNAVWHLVIGPLIGK